MKKVLSGIVAAVVALSFAGAANAVPATGDMGKAVSEMENPEQGGQPLTKKAKKPRKQVKKRTVKKKTAPASPEATPSGPAGTTAPEGK